jgi:hypothetical protein
MLKSLVQINPFFRPTAKEVLKSTIFDHIRNPKLEKTSVSYKIKLDIDHDDAFDYATGVSTKYQKDDYLNIILKEIKIVHDRYL